MIRILIGLGLITIISCDSNIGIATDKTQNDTYDTVQDSSENDIELSEEEDTGESEEPNENNLITDFSEWGPHWPYGITTQEYTVDVTNCLDMAYTVYTPYADDPPTIVLGHGFARGPETMTGWAAHFSSWGFEVLLPKLCHYNIFSGVDHAMNGQNLTELVSSHGATKVIYAGHSAGGLASVIAASIDLNALGVVGLDTTDTDGIPGVPDLLGQQYAGNMISPGFLIMGEPSSCNAENNSLDLFRIMDGHHAIRVTEADHCDFENPTDWVCESQCEYQNLVYTDEEIKSTIVLFATAATMSLADLSPDGIRTWEELTNKEIIQELE